MPAIAGLLGKASLSANAHTKIYQASAGIAAATCNIRVVNVDLVNSITIGLAIVPVTWTSGAPLSSDALEPFGMVLPAGSVLEETGIVLSAGEQVVAYASAATCTVRVSGFEQQ